ncbi:MAG TPA: VCBS repeat-containing protein [Pirellulales bacterium]|nr:VCBS repeat-containing protein [Pirellulales bacterium]
MHRSIPWVLLLVATRAALVSAADYQLDQFKTIPLVDAYYSEGANVGDIDGDGVQDAIYGPYWFKGPDYKEKYEIYPPKPQPVEGYANHFFCWAYDFNGDRHLDILTAGFPGTPAFVYENPGPAGLDKHWPRHTVLDSVCNESPQFLNIVGDERPEFVCTHDGYFGYATINWDKPLASWTFHNVSERNAPKPFGHGLGVGDINGDGRQDIITKDGWFAQPGSVESDSRWEFHPVSFAGSGGAEMYAYDVDGDGDNDVITSLAAHEFGLAWHEQRRQGDRIEFTPHTIMGSEPAANRYGLVFSELHSVNLADIDGDGLKDIVTGKTYYSHHKQSPLWNAGAVVYWFKLTRTKDGIDWIPFRAADDTGIGRQLTVTDINGDGLPDMIVGGMKGAHVLMHERKSVSRDEWEKARPRPVADEGKQAAGRD